MTEPDATPDPAPEPVPDRAPEADSAAGPSADQIRVACPNCHEPVAADDQFCEACGSALAAPDPVIVGGSPGTSTAPSATAVARSDGPQTQQVSRVIDPLDVVGATACPACGGAIDGDGFCAICGRRAPTLRDHWTETPGDWIGGVCDKGIVHARNEDAMALAATPDRTRAVLVVCDGVTSAPDSDRASIAASRTACRTLSEAPPPSSDAFPARLSHWEQMIVTACHDANAEAVGVAHRLGDPIEPPSCTFVAAVVDDDLVSVGWCGDSRAYWLPDGGEARQLGTDHSIGAELIAGGVPAAEAERHPGFHTITRWLGADSADPSAACVSQRLDVSGWVLVCSDGLWNYASDPPQLAELLEVAQRDGAVGPTAIAESLAAWANDQGGHDNITVALARFERRVP